MTRAPQRSVAIVVVLLGAASAAGCSRTPTVAKVNADASATTQAAGAASAHADGSVASAAAIAVVDAGSDAAGDAASSSAVRWITLNDASVAADGSRAGGIAVRPEIEIPARATDDGTPLEPRATILAGFPFVALRQRGLPAVSADGTRVAHLFGQQKCCRGPGYVDFTLYVFDAKTGAVKNKLLLWTVDDERRIPEVTTSTESRVAFFE